MAALSFVVLGEAFCLNLSTRVDGWIDGNHGQNHSGVDVGGWRVSCKFSVQRKAALFFTSLHFAGKKHEGMARFRLLLVCGAARRNAVGPELRKEFCKLPAGQCQCGIFLTCDMLGKQPAM